MLRKISLSLSISAGTEACFFASINLKIEVVKFLLSHKIEVFLIFVLIAGYFILRLPNLTLQPIFADEAIYVRWAQVMQSEPTLRFLPLSDGKTPLFMWVMIPLFKVFEDPLFAGRFLSVMAGFATLTGVFALGWRVFGTKVALWASLLYVITPYTVFFDRMALVDSMLSAFSIWSLYFAIWLIKSQRLDIAMILGYLLGGAILTKTSGMVNLLLLPISILAFIKGKNDRYGLVKLVLLWGVAIMIALLMYNMLRLGPQFQMLSSRNADYVFSPFELSGRPLDPFIPHLRDMADWFPKLFTPPILILTGVGVFFVVFNFNRLGLVVLFWALLPLLLEMAFLKTFTARYLLSSVAPFLIFAAFGLSKILGKIPAKNSVKIILALLLISPLALKFDYELITNPPPKDLPKEGRKGYFEDWTAGYGFKEISQFLIEKKALGRVVLGTEGFFGTLPDGIYIYLDKANISIVGSSATISAQLRNAATTHQTYFVGNKRRLEGSVKNAVLIKEYLKTQPLDGSPADDTVLYQVLPE